MGASHLQHEASVHDLLPQPVAASPELPREVPTTLLERKPFLTIAELLAEAAFLGTASLPRDRSAMWRLLKELGVLEKSNATGKALVVSIENLPAPLAKDRHRWRITHDELVQGQVTEQLQEEEASNQLDEKQRAVMDARLVVVSYLQELEDLVGRKAIATFIKQQSLGALPQYVLETIPTANAKSGDKSTVGKSALHEWRKALARQGATALATKHKDFMQARPWHTPLLELYQQSHQKLSVSKMVENWEDYFPEIEAPHVRRAQYFINQVPAPIKNFKRYGPNARRKFGPYTARSTNGLRPMDVVTADGHLFQAYVRHPDTGKPFRPEIAIYLDVLSRRPLGFSIWWAEAEVAVRIALTQMVTNPEFGVPCIHYTDNGPGYKAKQLRATLARLGCTITNSIPGNAQARGLVERFNSAVLIPLAKKYATYCGDDCDQETFRKEYRRAQDDNSLLPTIEDLHQALQKALDQHTNRPHRGLKGKTPMEVWNAAVQADGFEPVVLEPHDLYDLLPALERKCNRGVIQTPFGKYFAKALVMYHDRMVRAHYMPGDGSRIWVADGRGVLIATAERDAHTADYFPQNQLELAREKRAEGRLKRLERHRDQIEEERRAAIPMRDPLLELKAAEMEQESITVDRAALAEPATRAAPLFDPEDYDANRRHMGRYLDIKAEVEAGRSVGDEDREFLDMFGRTVMCSDFQRMLDDGYWTREELLRC